MSDKLDLILEKLDKLESNMATKEALTDIKSQINHRFDTLEIKTASIEKDISEIKNIVSSLQHNEPEDVLGMMKQINAKLEKNLVVDYSLISDKVADLEADLKLVKKVITNQ